ncbi:MAG: macrolide ABC transporter ATP-binding protein [Chloroflexi bacterium RBG_13_50_21]|nr:MAG: macrolide ABC transporter ATP-binding protein [Chloroflexi bacterium RBG_13_50_21]OGO63934.1 MAG: macrolide ABC transporter ATP-binding protein [Chloroflexi bacterium RBG_19FT_COMBO_47_9]
MSETALIKIDQITKIYQMGHVQVTALDGISLSVQTGEFLAIMGPSGSGKSTLMNILGCLDRPTTGTYLLDGEDISRMSRDQLARIRNRKVGFIFQSYHLLAQATAIQNVLMPIVYRRNGHVSTKDRMELAHNILNSVGLVDRDQHKPTEMSGGQQQRVAIARALINSPALILADEPTGNLDSHSGLEIMEILQNLHSQGRTIVMITHDARNAAFAERIIHLQDGKISEDNHNSVLPIPMTEGGLS